jgi:hypothetical protein
MEESQYYYGIGKTDEEKKILKISKRTRDYYINNRDKRLLTNKEYNKTHKMERRINDKIRYRKDFLNSLIRSCKYIERKKKIICTIIKDDLIEMYNNQYKKCYQIYVTKDFLYSFLKRDLTFTKLYFYLSQLECTTKG